MKLILSEGSNVCVKVSNNQLALSLHISCLEFSFVLESGIVKNADSVKLFSLKIATIHS